MVVHTVYNRNSKNKHTETQNPKKSSVNKRHLYTILDRRVQTLDPILGYKAGFHTHIVQLAQISILL